MKNSDIKVVCKAVIADHQKYIKAVGVRICRRCKNQLAPHDLNCPVLIAEKLLKEMKAESHDLSTNTSQGVWYQSAVSGLWYTNKKAVGACCAVMTDGEIVYLDEDKAEMK